MSYLKLNKSKDFNFEIDSSSFVTFLGDKNEYLFNILACLNNTSYLRINNKKVKDYDEYNIRLNIAYIKNSDLNVFTSETVEGEIAYSLEYTLKNKKEIRKLIEEQSEAYGLNEVLGKNPFILGSSEKAKLKILSSIIYNPKVLILNNIICELDYDDKIFIFKKLKEYVKEGNIVLNFTEDIEESLFGDRIIVTNDKTLVMDGKTLSVLNEDQIMKKLGLNLPFIVDINKYLMDYGIIDNYELNMDKLVSKLWK